jgi:hypothetical protein
LTYEKGNLFVFELSVGQRFFEPTHYVERVYYLRRSALAILVGNDLNLEQ